jgi:hypothetical protein
MSRFCGSARLRSSNVLVVARSAYDPPLHSNLGTSSQPSAEYLEWIAKLLALDARKTYPRPEKKWVRSGLDPIVVHLLGQPHGRSLLSDFLKNAEFVSRGD